MYRTSLRARTASTAITRSNGPGDPSEAGTTEIQGQRWHLTKDGGPHRTHLLSASPVYSKKASNRSQLTVDQSAGV
jgi:hypothetical protein